MAQIPKSIDDIKAQVLPRRLSTYEDAWKDGEHQTVRLSAPIAAVRVHVGASGAASLVPHLAGGAGIHGNWFAVGDVVQTYEQYRSSRALPAHFTEIALAHFEPGTVVNVGYCAPLFGLPGGGGQLKYLEGPRPKMQALDAVWSSTAGHA